MNYTNKKKIPLLFRIWAGRGVGAKLFKQGKKNLPRIRHDGVGTGVGGGRGIDWNAEK